MSLPTFPSFDPPLATEESLNMILASIAMEELGLSHIINAEGEKLQYVLGTLKGSPCKRASVDEVLAVNKSVKSLLDSVMQNQVILKSKMESAIGALEGGGSGITGPTGPPGPTGPAGPADSCRAASFPASAQCWSKGKSLIWSRSQCSKCCPIGLSPDGMHILLKTRGCCVVSFSIDLRAAECDEDCVSIQVQTREREKKVSRFGYHMPIIDDSVPFTVTAAGILIPARACERPIELMLTLQSPAVVKVNQASICVMEV